MSSFLSEIQAKKERKKKISFFVFLSFLIFSLFSSSFFFSPSPIDYLSSSLKLFLAKAAPEEKENLSQSFSIFPKQKKGKLIQTNPFSFSVFEKKGEKKEIIFFKKGQKKLKLSLPKKEKYSSLSFLSLFLKKEENGKENKNPFYQIDPNSVKIYDKKEKKYLKKGKDFYATLSGEIIKVPKEKGGEIKDNYLYLVSYSFGEFKPFIIKEKENKDKKEKEIQILLPKNITLSFKQGKNLKVKKGEKEIIKEIIPKPYLLNKGKKLFFSFEKEISPWKIEKDKKEKEKIIIQRKLLFSLKGKDKEKDKEKKEILTEKWTITQKGKIKFSLYFTQRETKNERFSLELSLILSSKNLKRKEINIQKEKGKIKIKDFTLDLSDFKNISKNEYLIEKTLPKSISLIFFPKGTKKERKIDPLITSATSGRWTDPSSWTGGAVPTSADSVQIQAGHTIIYDPGNLFQDNFEKGNFTGWTSSSSETGNSKTVTNEDSFYGNYSAKFIFGGETDSNVNYYQKYFSSNQPNIFLRFYFKVTSEALAAGEETSIVEITGYDSTQVVSKIVFQDVDDSGNYALKAYYHDGTSLTAYSTTYSISLNSWYAIELQYKAGDGDGEFHFFVDSTEVGTGVSSLSNSSYPARRIFIGQYNGQEDSALTYFIDEFAVDDSFRIYPIQTTISGITIDDGGELKFGDPIDISYSYQYLLRCQGDINVNGKLTSNGKSKIEIESIASDAEYGIIVSSTGFLSWQGSLSDEKDAEITAVTKDGTKDGYIYLQDGAEAIIKNTKISYLGTNSASKYGIVLEDVDLSSSEGAIFENVEISNCYQGIRLEGSSNVLISKVKIFSCENSGIVLTEDSLSVQSTENTIRESIIYANQNYGIEISSGSQNKIVNNTIDGNSNDGIYLASGSDSNEIKNNIITNHSTLGTEAIDDDGTSNTIDFNLFFGNDSDGSIGTNAIQGQDPLFNDRDGADNIYGTSDDDFYLQANSPALGAGVNLFDGTVPGYVNIGARLGYIKNDQGTPDNEADDNIFNFLQQAHDDDSLSPGDTVTAYTNDIVSDTIQGNITQIGTFLIQFDVSETTVTQSNQHEGMYLYIKSGKNRGKYYLIVDSKENADPTPDTITIFSQDSSSTFNPGDGFVIIDRVYDREGGNSANLHLTKSGTADQPITWTTLGTVIIDAQKTQAYGIYIYPASSLVIKNFIIENARSYGIYANGSSRNRIEENTILLNYRGIYWSAGAGNYYYNVFKKNIIFSNETNGIQLSYPSQNAVLENILFDNSSVGISITSGKNQRPIISNNVIFGNSSGISFLYSDYVTVKNNLIFSNSTAGLVTSNGATYNKILNNVFVSNTDGINFYSSTDSNNEVKNNIFAYNSDDGLDDNGTSLYDFNLYYQNTTDYEGSSSIGSNSITGQDPLFYIEDSGQLEAGSTQDILYDADKNWKENQWVGYGVKITVGTSTYWAGITSNTKNRLFITPSLPVSPSAGDSYEITNFYLQKDSPALGQGQDIYNQTEPGYVNIGARLGYIKNDQGTPDDATDDNVFNFLQQAHSDASLTAGDTITTYTNNIVSGTIGQTITDNGPYVTLDIEEEDLITEDDQLEGNYLYIEAGQNRGKYYLIVDSNENSTADGDATDIDTISILSDSVEGFSQGDKFVVIDRVYDREGNASKNTNLYLTKDGTAISPIIWNTFGRVIIDAENERAHGIYTYDANYNKIEGFIIQNATSSGIYLGGYYGSKYNVVSNNICHSNSIAGIESVSSYNIITLNVCYANKYGLRLKGGAKSNIIFENNFYSNTDKGVYNYYSNTINNVISSNNIFANADDGVHFWHGNNNSFVENRIFKNGGAGIQLAFNADSNFVYNNTINNNDYGIHLSGSSPNAPDNNILKNNIVSNNLTYGLRVYTGGAGSNNSSDFNLYYNNGTDVSGELSLGSNSITGQDPLFFWEVQATADDGGTSSMIYDASMNWKENQWVGYAVYIEGTSCPAGDGVWAGITSNTKNRLYLAPALSGNVDSNCTYKITNFYLQKDSPALGQGQDIYNQTEPGYVNIGARLGYIKNDQGTPSDATDDNIFNFLQQAHDDASLSPGDTITVYTNNITSGTIGQTITDNGPYITLDIQEEDLITEDNQLEGNYLYIEAGQNRGKYYLIIDSQENSTADGDSTDIDTISILTDSTEGFNEGDRFIIIDRVYTREGQNSSGLYLTKDGTETSPIKWTTSGTVILDGENSLTYGVRFYNSDYTILDGFVIERFTYDGIHFHYYINGSVIKNNLILLNDIGIVLVDGISKDILENNEIFESSSYGIYFSYGVSQVQLIENKIYKNGQGIYRNVRADLIENTIFGNSSYGINAGDISYPSRLLRNVILGNGSSGIVLSGGSYTYQFKLFNNVSVGNTGNGIYLGNAQDNEIKNNILAFNGEAGLKDLQSAGLNTYDYNLYYQNSIDYSGNGSIGPNSITGQDPLFFWEVQATADDGGTSSMIYDASMNWKENQWVGYAVYIEGTSCPAGDGVWAGITSNTKNRLYLAPALSGNVDSNCTYKITNFYLQKDSPALGQGQDIYNQTEPGYVNIGARLGYIKNDQGTPSDATDDNIFNFLQQAHDDASLSPGDTITAYTNNIVSGTIGQTITDNGPYITLDIQEEDLITEDDQLEGNYLYIEAGQNRGKYYLIVDSNENSTADGDATDIDTISILSDSVEGFNEEDKFIIIDRVYKREGGSSAILSVNKSGIAEAPIKWTTQGKVVIDAHGVLKRGIFLTNYTKYHIFEGFDIQNNIYDHSGGGFYLTRSSYNIFRNNFVHDSNNCWKAYAGDSKGNVIINNLFINCKGDVTASSGVSFAWDGGDNIIYSNIVLDSVGRSIGSSPNSLVFGNVIVDSLNDGIKITHNNVSVVGNIFIQTPNRDRYYAQVRVSGGTGVKVINNTIVGGQQDGIQLDSGVTPIVKNNIIAYSDNEGIDDNSSQAVISHNLFYGNAIDGNVGTDAITGQDPLFYIEDSGQLEAGSTQDILYDADKNWKENQWVGYGVKITVGTSTYWAGITSNTKNRLFITPSLPVSPSAGDSYEITNFYLQKDSPALGQGQDIYNQTKPGYVNIGARLGYVKNITDNISFNWLQQAHDDTSLTAGDTITVYTVNEVSGTIGQTITDNGPYITLDIEEEDIITEDNQLEGNYLYLTSGQNKGKYYLIVDSNENSTANEDATDTDTISILTDSSSGFSSGDSFVVIDRVYKREGAQSSNLYITKDGTSTSPITWTSSGTVIIDAENKRARAILVYGAEFNIVDGFVVENATTAGIHVYYYANNNIVQNNVATQNNAGIVIQSSSCYYNQVLNNEVFSNDNTGINLYDSKQNLVKGNISQNNGSYGIYVSGGFDTQHIIIENKIYSNNGGGIYLVSSKDLVAENEIYQNSSAGITIDGGDEVTVYANILHANDQGINLNPYSSDYATSNYILNNTISQNGFGIIFMYGPGHIDNVIKNNIIYNNTTGIDTGDDSAEIDHNLFYGNTSDGSTGTNAIVGQDPLFVSTDPTSSDFMYLQKDSPALGAGVDLFDGTVPGYVNIGARLGYIKNDQGTPSDATDDNIFNFLQQAHDDASLTAGDTVTAYTNDIVSDTIQGNITQIGTFLIQFDVSETTVTQSNQHEGMYLYIKSGKNRGKYYLIVDSKENADPTPDTITIFSQDSSSTFNPGDGFVIIDRVYDREGGNSANLYLTKDGTQEAPITFKGEGTVILDAKKERNYLIYIRTGNNWIIEKLILINAKSIGLTTGYNCNYLTLKDLVIGYAGGKGIFVPSDGDYYVISENTIFETGDIGISLDGRHHTVRKNVVYQIGYMGIRVRADDSVVDQNIIFSTASTGIYAMGGGNSQTTISRNIVLRTKGNGLNIGYYTTQDKLVNNTVVASSSHGIFISSDSPNNTLKNNIFVYNGGNGITNYANENTFHDFNLMYGNGGADYVGSDGPGPNSITGQDPLFFWEVQATADDGGTSSMIYDASMNWKENQWVGYAVYIEGTSCPAGDGVWAGITSNTKNRLYLAPTLSGPIDSNCTYKITNFYLQKDSPALGQGEDIYNQTEPGYVNIGARLGYIKNDQGTPSDATDDNIFNFLQQAHDDASLSPGDTITVYTNNITSGTIGQTITDNGPYITLDIQEEDLITEDNQLEGNYLYIEAGQNRGKYYLIIDSQENSTADGDSTDTDTISILSDSAEGFSQGDKFVVIDRVYDREGKSEVNLEIGKSGTSTDPITWAASGKVIIEAENREGIRILWCKYNIIDGFIIENATIGIYSQCGGECFHEIRNNILAYNNLGYDTYGDDNLSIHNNILFNNGTALRLRYSSLDKIFDNIIYGNSSVMSPVSLSFIWNNKIFGNEEGINLYFASKTVVARNLIFKNSGSGIYIAEEADNNVIYHNIITANTSIGIELNAGGYGSPDNTIIRNNIISENGNYGIWEENGITGTNSDYNLYYNNGTDTYYGSATGQDANSIIDQDPLFYIEDSGQLEAGSTQDILYDADKNWKENQWVGYGVKITVGTSTYWAGITSNTKNRLFITPSLPVSPSAGDSYEITNFYLQKDSPALGQGQDIYNQTEPGYVNIGARLGYIKNDQGTPSDATDDNIFNFLQQAHDDASLSPGDTVTAYTNNIVSGTIGQTITDNGPYITLDIQEEDLITEDDQLEGNYLYIEAGQNRGKYYLIVDSNENSTADGDATDIDTISILSDSTEGFNEGDKFVVIDRVYDRLSHEKANIYLSKSGNSMEERITFSSFGKVIIEAKEKRDYNIFDDPTLSYLFVCDIDLQGYLSSPVAGNSTFEHDESSLYGDCYCWPQCNSAPRNLSFEIKDHKDKEDIYPSYTYIFEVKVKDIDGYQDLKKVSLILDPEDENQEVIWQKDSNSFSENSSYFDLDLTQSKSTCQDKECIIDFALIFNFSWEKIDDKNVKVKVISEDKEGGKDETIFSNDTFFFENDLVFKGKVSLKEKETQREINEGDWVKGETILLWQGLSVFFEDSDVSPKDKDFDIQISNDDGKTWIQDKGNDLYLETETDKETDIEDIWQIEITNIPQGGSSLSKITFKIKIDASPPKADGLSLESLTSTSAKISVKGARDDESGLANSPYLFLIKKGDQEISSSWISSPSYKIENLTPNSPLSVSLFLKDKVSNETLFFVTLSFYTLSNPPKDIVVEKIEKEKIKVSFLPNQNPPSTEYQCKIEEKETKKETLSSWLPQTSFIFEIEKGKTYLISCRSRNNDGKETEWSTPLIFYSEKEKIEKAKEISPKEIEIYLSGSNLSLFAKEKEEKKTKEKIGIIHVFPKTKIILKIRKDKIEEKSKKEILQISLTFLSKTYLLDFKKEENLYQKEIEAPEVEGKYNLFLIITYKDKTAETISFSLLVDPFGYVYETKIIKGEKRQIRLPNVKVTLFWEKEKGSGKFEIFPAQKFNQQNPQKTNFAGEYGFLVPQGKRYYLFFEKEGYFPKKTEIFLAKASPIRKNVELLAKPKSLLEVIFEIKNIVIILLSLGLFAALLYIFWRKRKEKEEF